MTQTISRIYPLRDNADAAASELKSVGFAEDVIHVIAPAEAPREQVIERLQQGGVATTHTEVFADCIERGETLVSVQASFGCAATVTAILDKHSPADKGIPEQGYDRPPPDPATPLSSACGWRVLIDNPTPLSSYLGWPVLSTHKPSRKLDSDLVDNPAPFSKAMHTPVLTDRPAILSSPLGWKLLLNDPAPLSRLLGLRVLSSDPPK